MNDSRSMHETFMRRAIALARRGEGRVEPNPMVGCVIVHEGDVVAEGWHEQFGGPHAEVAALASLERHPAECVLYVTLEPCAHTGKTPPCTEAILNSGIRQVVVAQRDPFPQVNGGGLRVLREQRVDITYGVCEREARELNRPYLKLVERGRPWMIAKWAATLDGKLATSTGDSRWISSEESRRRVHALRGRMDGILVGCGTAATDDPRLTARPPGPRVAMRMVWDSHATLAADSQLVRTARDIPVLVGCCGHADPRDIERLRDSGCDTFCSDADQTADQLAAFLDELGRRRITNVLVEGGGSLLGHLFDGKHIDEVHTFIAPRIAGGQDATVIGGAGVAQIVDALPLRDVVVEQTGGDVYVRGLTNHPQPNAAGG